MKKTRVLISGGGIAGMAAAWWLERAGAEVTIVERAHEFRPLGHYITLRSHGYRTIESMGLLDACRERALSFRELRAFSPQGDLFRTVDAEMLARRVEGAILFRRADLHAALYDAVRSTTDVRFGEEVQAIREEGTAVAVEVAGRTDRYDLVLGADGVHSHARSLVFGEGGLTPMGGHYIAMTVRYPHGLTPGGGGAYLGRGQFVILIPRTPEEVSAIVYHGDGGLEPGARDAASVRAFLLEAYREFAPEVRRTFEALGPDAFVFIDSISMVKLPRITRGRIALLGDAAHCPTFMSGMGASLALQGAHALSDALAANPGAIEAGVAAYEHEISSVATAYQASAYKARRFILDRSAILAGARNAIVKYTPDWALGLSARRFYHANHAMP